MARTSAGSGSRGGPLPPLTLAEAQALLAEWRAEDVAWVRERILLLAQTHGEFHAEMLQDDPLVERNTIGAQVNALLKARLIASTGEHRASRNPASHGRRSYVYRLTARGTGMVRALRSAPGAPPPPPPPVNQLAIPF